MSTHHIPYPSDFDVNHAAAHQEERRRRALRRVMTGEVLAVIDDRIAAEPDPRKHPLYHLVEFLLDRELAVHGGEFFDTFKALCLDAIDRCVDDVLSQED
jgi:hypothetical protein